MARLKKRTEETVQPKTEQESFEQLVTNFIEEIFGKNVKIKTVDLSPKEEDKEIKKVPKRNKKELTLDEQLLKVNELIKDILLSNNSNAIQQVEKTSKQLEKLEKQLEKAIKALEEEKEKNRNLQLELDETKENNRSLINTNHNLNNRIEELEDEIQYDDEEDEDYEDDCNEDYSKDEDEKDLDREEKLLKELAEKAHKTRE